MQFWIRKQRHWRKSASSADNCRMWFRSKKRSGETAAVFCIQYRHQKHASGIACHCTLVDCAVWLAFHCTLWLASKVSAPKRGVRKAHSDQQQPRGILLPTPCSQKRPSCMYVSHQRCSGQSLESSGEKNSGETQERATKMKTERSKKRRGKNKKMDGETEIYVRATKWERDTQLQQCSAVQSEARNLMSLSRLTACLLSPKASATTLHRTARAHVQWLH